MRFFKLVIVVCGFRLQSEGCRFESRPGLRDIKVYSAFHPSWVGRWIPAIAGKTKARMGHSGWGWTCGCAGKAVKSLENTRHTWALLRWWFTTNRRYIKCMHPYLYLYLLTISPYPSPNRNLMWFGLPPNLTVQFLPWSMCYLSIEFWKKIGWVVFFA